jgi:MFS family permease
MDLSSEMIHALLPVFVTSVLGASMTTLGIIEGVAEGTAAFAKVFAGTLSDRARRRKPLVVLGYGLSALTKPFFPLAQSASWVFSARFVDRIGKGIRGAPRDALIADITPPASRGAAFGLRQALDTAGALAGPLLALGLMVALVGSDEFRIRTVFWIAAVPAAFAVLLLLLFVREPAEHAAPGEPRALPHRSDIRQLGRGFWLIVAIGGLFSLARFSEAFLVLRVTEAFVQPGEEARSALALAPLALAVMNLTYVLTAYPFGKAADRLNRLGLLAGGLVVLIASDAVLAFGTSLAAALGGVAMWGVHMGITQGLLSAMVADAAPKALRGTAFGVYNCVSGMAALAASVLAGLLWTQIGPKGTFLTGAAFAAAALASLLWSAKGSIRRL